MLVNMLTKRYGSSIVLNDLSLDFNQGELVGLIGRNGAGKSTLMKIITQTIQTYDGSVPVIKWVLDRGTKAIQ